jgi:transcriptional regulator with XRE-family HTH domain
MKVENERLRIGKKIKSLRDINKLTQEKLGEKAGLSYKYIGELERGKVNVSLDSLVKIATALEISVDELFKKDDEQVIIKN